MSLRNWLRDLHWTFPGLAAFLGALGGWGWIWLRRFALPLLGGALAAAYGLRWWRALLYASATAVAFSCPYSPDRHGWLFIFAIGATYGMTPWILDYRKERRWWPILTGLTLAELLMLSAHGAGWAHKWTEGLVFGLHGFLVSWTIDKRTA